MKINKTAVFLRGGGGQAGEGVPALMTISLYKWWLFKQRENGIEFIVASLFDIEKNH